MGVVAIAKTSRARAGTKIREPNVIAHSTHYTMNFPEAIADLKARRRELGLTQAQACARVQGRLAPSQLACVEKGMRPPPKRVADYAAAYDLSEEMFWRRWAANGAVPA